MSSSESSGFFGKTEYATPETRALSAIQDAPAPDQNTDFNQLVQRHDAELKLVVTQLQKVQQGLNDATQNPIQQLQQFISDLVVLFGGGELAQGVLDFGDLKYLLPALGALFGFGSGPYPVNLLQAAEKFFLGYVVPSEQYADLLTHFIDTWAGFLGIDPKFVKDVDALVTAVADLFDGVQNLLPSMQSLLSALGLGSGRDLGPLGQSLYSVLHLFNGVDTSLYTDITGFVTGAMDTFVINLTAVINWIDEVLRIFEAGGDVVNSPLGDITAPFVTLFGQVQYLAITGLYDVEQGFENIGSSVLKFLTPSGGGLGQFDAAALTGAVNTAVTLSGNAISSLFNGSGALASALTGALNTEVTVSGNAISALFNGSGALASALTGALNTGVTISGNAISALFNSSGVLASVVNGALNTAVTISGNALSTLFNGSGLIASQIAGALNPAVTFLVGASNVALSTLLGNLSATGTLVGSAVTGALNSAVTLGGNAISTLFNGSGLIASQIAGALNTAVTISGNAVSALFNGSGVLASALTGAFNTAVTFGGTAASTLFQWLDSSGQFNVAHATGAINTGITISGNAISSLFNGSGVLGSAITGAINTAATISGNAISALFNSSGVLASALTGALNTAVTLRGAALSTLFNSSANFIGVLDAAATGVLNSAITFAGTALSTVLTNITPSTGAITGTGVTGLLATGNDIVTDIGNAIDNLVNIFTGGSGSGNAPAALPAAAAAIPHTNIVPPANPGSTVSHDASANATPVTGTGHTLSITPYSHAVAVGGYLTVKVATLSDYPGALPAVVTFGGTTMPLLINSYNGYISSGAKYVTVSIYGLAVPAGQTANVAASATAVAPFAGDHVYTMQVESDSYLGVGSIGTTNITAPSNSSLSGAVASANNNWVVEAAAVVAPNSETWSSYNKTSRYNPGSTFNATPSSYLAMITGDGIASGSTISFTATASYTTQNAVAGAAVNLVPSPVTILGSGFRQYRAATGSATTSSGDQLLPNSFFDTNDKLTSDLTSAPATNNKLTISNAGWYLVVISVFGSLTGNTQDLGILLYQNGTIVQRGQIIVPQGAYVSPIPGTFIVYCAAGDTLQPGVNATSGVSMIGEATGTKCYWEVALMNRGVLS